MNLENKKVLVTGGTEGIGAAIVDQLLRRRAQVITCARHEPSQALKDGVIFRRCDLASAGDRRALISWLFAEHPDTAVLINNAGVQHLMDFHQTDSSRIETESQLELSLNLEAPIMLCAGLLPMLVRQPEAAIVNITTGLALAPKKSSPVYCATKAGLRSFTRSLRYQVEDVAPTVRVQEVLPPLVETRMTAGRGTGKMKPEDVAIQVVSAIERGVEECYVGKSRLLKWMMRIAPGVVYKVLKTW
ncbi:MAG: SDR family NAD(P)-dependent oxidoreductase [Lautropia sp.]|nr:SDR family NAD(P)-dependent oxidoreductase [Lautropia sp.]